MSPEIPPANNREVERRREAEEEVAFWRREVAAKLSMMSALHDAAGHYEAASIRVTHMMPILNALRDADAKEWHQRCEICGEFLARGARLSLIGLDEDGSTARVHAACIHAPDEETFVEVDDSAAVIARAKAIVEGPE